MTFEQAFVKIKEKFKDVDISKFNHDFAIQVNLSDEDSGGAFYVQFIDGKLFVEPYDYHDNTADLTINRVDFNKLITGKLDIEKAKSEGNVYVNGSMEDVISVLGSVKTPAKKPAAKKVEPAKKQTEAKASPKATKKSATKKAK